MSRTTRVLGCWVALEISAPACTSADPEHDIARADCALELPFTDLRIADLTVRR